MSPHTPVSSSVGDASVPRLHCLWGDDQAAAALGSLAGGGGPGSPRAEELTHRLITLDGLDAAAVQRVRRLAEECGGVAVTPRPRGDEGSGRPPERHAQRVLLAGSARCLERMGQTLEAEAGSLAGVGAEVRRALAPRAREMSWGERRLEFGPRPLVMGILNCTPDSFYPGSRLAGGPDALSAAEGMIEAGADILDVGGESTRPGSDPVPAQEEKRRVLPVIEALRSRFQGVISIDTRKAEVASAALEAGADLVNDVGALDRSADAAAMLGLVAERGVPVVLMHMRGEPKTMQAAPHYEDALGEIIAELAEAVHRAVAVGVRRERIIVDPGIGFGKRCEDNLRVLAQLRSFHCLGCPLLIGLSRKSFLGVVLDQPVEQRLVATVTANALAVLAGADIVRVHDVAEAAAMARIIEAVRLERCPGRRASEPLDGSRAGAG